jgi:5-methyltetrahydropteroyltriglutamate--homocysteine methyltransferase
MGRLKAAPTTDESMTSPLPALPTTVIGSYSMPEWLERAKNEYLSRRLSKRDLDEMHDAVRKASIKDQETAGIDIVSDGEAQRDNMIDYFTERMPGVQVDLGSKRFYYDFYESVVRSKLATGTLGLGDEAKFLSKFSTRPSKISLSGPHTLVKRIQNKHYSSEADFALDIGKLLNLELKELVRAGATRLQIDEPYYSGFPEDLPWALRAINEMVSGVDAHITLHICYGNRYGKPSFEGSYQFLFPAIMDARVQAISMEFARRGEEDIQLFKTVPFQVGIGVIDVKTNEVESSAFVADRIRRALEVIPTERLIITPDCGLVRLPREVAFSKLNAMVEGTRAVRKELGK